MTALPVSFMKGKIIKCICTKYGHEYVTEVDPTPHPATKQTKANKLTTTKNLYYAFTYIISEEENGTTSFC